MKYRLFAFIPILAGCTATPDYLTTGLSRLEGRPVAELRSYLGEPTLKWQAGEKTAYAWINNRTGRFDMPRTAPMPVVVQRGGVPVVTYTNQPPSIVDDYNWYCRIDVTTKKNVIVDTAYQGNAGGCQAFNAKLKPLLETQEK